MPIAETPTSPDIEKGNRSLERRVADLQRSRETLQKTSNFLETIIELAAEGLCVCHAIKAYPHIRFTVWNHRMSEITGYTLSEINRLGWYQSLYPDPDMRLKALKRMNEVRSGRHMESETWEITRADGEKRIISISTSGMPTGNGQIQVLALIQDITDRNRAQAKLRESEAKYRMLVEHQTDMVIKLDSDGRFLFASPSYCNMFGKRETQLLGQRFIPLVHADDREPTLRAMEKLFQPPYSAYVEQRAMTRFGWRWLAWSLSAVLSPDGEMDAVICVGRDIHDKKHSEKALAESEAAYRTLAQNLPCIVYRVHVRESNRMEVFNDMLPAITGYEITELKNGESCNIAPLILSQDYQRVVEIVQKALTANTPFEVEYRIRHKDGTIHYLFEKGRPINDSQGEPIYIDGVIFDISQRRISEAESEKLKIRLQRAQKMEAIGNLAGKVAHDLNNILAGIVTYPGALMKQLPADSPLKGPLSKILDTGKKAAAIVEDLLDLARRKSAASDLLDLNAIISEYLSSPEYDHLKADYPDVKVETRLASDLMNISGASVHLFKTVMNLVTNAFEAMDQSGQIVITTENRHVDVPIKGYDHIRQGNYVVLLVSDTGVGISEEELERIFEPFYSSKQVGRSGTGLGLAVVWETVKDHKGYIDIHSRPGQGTIFSIYLPATDIIRSDPEGISILEEHRGSGERILVVDDQVEQRDIAAEILTELGYQVHTAADSNDTLTLVQRTEFDLVMLDMIMGKDIDGLDIFKQILKIRPHQRAIITSGYSETRRVKQALKLGAMRFVKKPYTLEDISAAVKSVLTGG